MSKTDSHDLDEIVNEDDGDIYNTIFSSVIDRSPIKRYHSTYTNRRYYSNCSNSRHYSTLPVNPITNNKGLNSKDNKDSENLLFNNIKLILNSEGFNSIAQEKIEREVYNFAKHVSANQDSIIKFFGGFYSSLLQNPKFKAFIFDVYDQILSYVDKLKVETTTKISKKKVLKEKDAFDKLFSIIFEELSINDFFSAMIISIFRAITYHNIHNKNEDKFYVNSEVNLVIELGEYIVLRLIRILYKKQGDNEFKYSQFKKSLLERYPFKILEYEGKSLIYSKIGFKFLSILKEVEMIKSEIVVNSKTEKISTIILADKFTSSFDYKIINQGLDVKLNLPMIVKPIDYIVGDGKDENLVKGGYYLNNSLFYQPLINTKYTQTGKPKIITSTIINALNNMMSIPFKINTELLKFLMENKDLLIPNEHPLMNKAKRTRREESIYQSYLSEKILQDYIIKIADTFASAPELYFPLHLDFRCIISSRVTYLNYQGSELAKALLLFSIPAIIYRSEDISINYLKAYSATCYEQKLDKKSYNDKVEWVHANINNIVNLDKELIRWSDNPFKFIASCLELKRLYEFLNNNNISEFQSFLPIQLDDTCNGFQHLSLLSEVLWNVSNKKYIII